MREIVTVRAWKSEAAVEQERTGCLQSFMFRRLNNVGPLLKYQNPQEKLVWWEK